MLLFFKGFQDLFGTRAHGDVFGKIHPPNDAIRIKQKFSRTGNVRTFRPGAAMQQVVTPNDPGVRVGQEWK